MPAEKQKVVRLTKLTVDLKDLKTPWVVWCKARGLTPSEAVRSLLGTVLRQNPISEPVSQLDEGVVSSDDVRKRLEIRLSTAEHAALSLMADREGMGLARWFQALVRVHLTGRAQFGTIEVEALTRSSQNLLAIGRNINQIARHMKELSDSEALSLDYIEMTLREIREHRTLVTKVLAANAKRWRL